MNIFTICSLYIHYIFTVCSQYVHNIPTIYSLYVHYMPTIYSLYVHYITIIYSLLFTIWKLKERSNVFPDCIIRCIYSKYIVNI